MSGVTYQCAACRVVFVSDWDDDDAGVEAAATWPGLPAEEMVTVCDDCYVEMMERTIDEMTDESDPAAWWCRCGRCGPVKR